ncbi:AAA family ATPase [Candidatus Dojkabacteria bacterium]|nr:AAA family ATPase [Candidatus Dojkabacteria bacterium]
MMYITRDQSLVKDIKSKMFSGKAILIQGARQVGKTTLVQRLLSNFENGRIKKLNFDDPDNVDLIMGKGFRYLKGLFDEADIIFLDEIQKLPEAGNTVKMLVDNYKKTKQVIITGSSSIFLSNQIKESLTGRKYTYNLYPFSYRELSKEYGREYFPLNTETILKYGLYPEVHSVTSFKEKEELLDEITDSYLYKDILELQRIKNPLVLRKLLRALALQIGSEVSVNELARKVELSKNTVDSYIDLLEKSFVLFRLPAYSSNKRREISRNKKIYFYDVGIRNAVINDFRDMDLRNDVGHLWENLIISERLKLLSYSKKKAGQYFWRTFDGAEVDYVEESAGEVAGYEIKRNSNKTSRVPQKWADGAGDSYMVVNDENYGQFLSKA